MTASYIQTDEKLRLDPLPQGKVLLSEEGAEEWFAARSIELVGIEIDEKAKPPRLIGAVPALWHSVVLPFKTMSVGETYDFAMFLADRPFEMRTLNIAAPPNIILEVRSEQAVIYAFTTTATKGHFIEELLFSYEPTGTEAIGMRVINNTGLTANVGGYFRFRFQP